MDQATRRRLGVQNTVTPFCKAGNTLCAIRADLGKKTMRFMDWLEISRDFPSVLLKEKSTSAQLHNLKIALMNSYIVSLIRKKI